MDDFKRDILQELNHWAEKKQRKPLVLRGARQVGKTSVVSAFGKQFENYLYVNLEKRVFLSLFEQSQNVGQILMQIFAILEKPQKEGRTLLFLDEIQNSAAAIQMLRYFYEERPDIYVIAAGSLLETLINVHVSFPVGRVEYMAMRPVSFREFLTANGNEMLRQYIEQQSPELTVALHEKLITEFRNYSLVGGMPEVVQHFVNEHNLPSLNTIYESLLRGYKDDVEKYASNKTQVQVIRFLIDKGWTEMSKIISLGNFAGSSYKAREVGEAFRVMERAMLLELVYPNSTTELPLIPQLTRSPKLFWLDVGLANYATGAQKDALLATDLLDVWRGAVAEQLVAQELLTLSNSVDARRSFWNRLKSEAEVDFEYVYDGEVIPVEVKAGHNAHLRSLHEFMDASKGNLAVRIWSHPFQIDSVKTPRGKIFTLVNLPFYLIGCLPTIVQSKL